MTEKLIDYIIKTKKSDPETWLPEKLGAPDNKKMRPATHIGKYTHPYMDKHVSIMAPSTPRPKGYLCSGNFTTSLQDYAGSASELPYSKTMEAEMEDGRPLREHLQEGSHLLKRICNVDDQTLHAWRKEWGREQEQSRDTRITDRRLKQIYFPLGGDQYQLLSLLPCSVLIWELKARLNSRRWQEKSNSDTKKSPTAFFNQCQARYGGTKPQNVSFLNSENGGRAVKLICSPPALNRKYRLPTRNFFNLVRPNRFQRSTDGQVHLWQLFESLYQTLAFDPNTDWARRKKRGIVRAIIERGIILPAENIRANAPVGWSMNDKYSGIPQEQKSWLDPDCPKEPDETICEDWQRAISRSIATFITIYLEKTIKSDPTKKAISMDDVFANEIVGVAREYLHG